MKETIFIAAYLVSSCSLTYMLVNARIFQWFRDWANKMVPVYTKRMLPDEHNEYMPPISLEGAVYYDHHMPFVYVKTGERKRKFFPDVLQCSLCCGFHVGYINAVWVAVAYFCFWPMILVNAALCVAIIAFIMDKWIDKLRVQPLIQGAMNTTQSVTEEYAKLNYATCQRQLGMYTSAVNQAKQIANSLDDQYKTPQEKAENIRILKELLNKCIPCGK